MATPDLKEYQGNCHCGAFKFKVNLPEVKAATACNCSICHKKGYLWVFPGEGQLAIERGESTLTNYEFNAKTMGHRFCPTCGTGVMGFRYGAPAGKNIGLNVRTLMGLDPFSLEIHSFDGKGKYKPDYVPPKFTGELPHVEGEGLKVYTGGCHCGAVTLAVKCKPLPQMALRECSCSICQRNGYAFVYPSKSQVSIVGGENTTAYFFGRKYASHHFCKTCGISCYPIFSGLSQEEYDALPQNKKEDAKKLMLDIQPVNLRVLDGVEWEQLKLEKIIDDQAGYVVD